MSDIQKEQELEALRALLEAPTVEDATNSNGRPLPADLTQLEEQLGNYRSPTSWVHSYPMPKPGEALPDEQPPSILQVATTGRHLLYPNSVNSIYGRTTAGKTWLAIVATAEVINRGGRVLWLDYEGKFSKFLKRLETLMVDRDRWELVTYRKPFDRLWDHKAGQYNLWAKQDLDTLLTQHRYDLVVVDTMSGAMTMEGLDSNSLNDVELIYRVFFDQLTEATDGASVLVLDHVNKSKESTDYATGSVRKLDRIDGAAYLLEVEKPWYRATTETIYGRAKLKVTKDREGYVQGASNAVAVIDVTATPDGYLDFRISDPKDSVAPLDFDLARKILDWITFVGGRATLTNIRDNVQGASNERVSATLKALAARADLITEPRSGGGVFFSINTANAKAHGLLD
jgi:KaiC/GvpD/RAD55 family RecA-like ATPase